MAMLVATLALATPVFTAESSAAQVQTATPTSLMPTVEPRQITETQAVEMALKADPNVIRAAGDVAISRSSVRTSYGAFLPSIGLSAGTARQIPSGGQRTTIVNGQVVILPAEPWSANIGLSANVDIFTGGQRFFDLRQAKANLEGARYGELATRFDAILNVKQQYYNVLASREAQDAAAAQLEQANVQLRTASARTRAKVATRSDSLRAEIQVRAGEIAVLEADNALALSIAGLTRATGSPVPVTAVETDTLPTTTLALDDQMLRLAAEHGPAVVQAQAAYDAAVAASHSAWSDYLPSVSAGYSRNGSNVGENPEFAGDQFSYNGALRFSASMPLFDGFRREANVTAAQAQRRNAEAALRDAKLAAIENLTNQLGVFRSATERVASQIATVEAAEEDLRVQEQRYTAGGSTQLDVLASQTQLNEARRDLIRARYDQRVAKAQLEALVGRSL
jgi:outer membrane protein